MSTKGSPDTVEPDKKSSPYLCEQLEGTARRQPTSAHQSGLHKPPPTSPVCSTPVAQSHTSHPTSHPTVFALPNSAVSFSSWPTDCSYTPAPQQPESPRMTEDKSEVEVMMAGRAYFTVIHKMLEDKSQSQLTSSIYVPKALRLVVDGLQINCHLDLLNRISTIDKPGCEVPKGDAHWEVSIRSMQQ